MIDKILDSSRALLSLPPKKEIYFYFDHITNHVKTSYPNIYLPSVIIVYSLNKLCETFRYGDTSYIIYDQYLGQAFNKFNRLIYHEDNVEVQAYLCKLIAEEYYLLNDIESCLAHLLSYQVNSKANAVDLPKEIFLKKSQLIFVQESFVLLHEIAHNLIIADPKLISKAENFIESSKEAQVVINGFIELTREVRSDKGLTHFYEEFACDIIALELTHSFYLNLQGFTRASILEGIALAFLYLRTLIDTKLKAADAYETSKSEYHLFTKLRYNLLRFYYTSSFFLDSDKDDLPLLIELYEKWEEKIDMNVVLFLNNELKAKLKNVLHTCDVPIDKKILKEMLKLPH
jgi:hypothetical protein